MSLPRVVIAMSGGVDSSVAAALLNEQGYDVVGVTMRIWDDDQVFARGACRSKGRAASGRGCCGMGAIDDARRVAHQLGIPHYTYDFRPDFQKMVVDDFCAEYARGRTPNPCIRCNRFLKFDLLLDKAKELDAAFVATGHYAKVLRPDSDPVAQWSSGLVESLDHLAARPLDHSTDPDRFLLMRSADPVKDQTYFLYSLTQHQLSHALFPLGDMTKKEVREVARKLGLTTAEKKESQEVCFAPGGSYIDFLKRRFPELHRPGPILDLSGKVIGEHKGIIHYTIGQRRRIGIAAPKPLYVITIDPEHNSITVGGEQDAYSSEMTVGDLNFISIPDLKTSIRAKVQIRHQHKAASADIIPQEDAETRRRGDTETRRHGDAETRRRGDAEIAKVSVHFDVPQWALTPGQAAVFYDGDVVIGGGIIDRQK
jgi:tRNA-specific 2-thiouridylase